MEPNKLVVHFKDGHVLKGHSLDFVPNKRTFHLAAMKNPELVAEIILEDLKAVFFVKDFIGNPKHNEQKVFDPGARYIGKRIVVRFLDGEVFAGIRQAFNPAFPGFFISPVDQTSNTIRAFVINSSIAAVEEA